MPRTAPALLALSAPLHLGLLGLLAGCGSEWKSEDLDGDGYTVEDGDCWESSEPLGSSGLTGADVHPGADDLPYDGVDADCGGNDDFDLDGDGWVELEEHIGAVTVNVAGSGQHFGAGDCQNEAGVVLPALNGFTDLASALVHPEADDELYDGIDANCDEADDFDADLDGEGAAAYLGLDGAPGTDCDDDNSAIYSGAEEICDGIDNDCDALLDIDDPDLDPAAYATYYTDIDGDGYGDDATAEASCEAIPGGVLLGGDCDDLAVGTNPGVLERCDGIDNDCDLLIDDADDSLDPASASSWYADLDGDTYGDPAGLILLCAPPDGLTYVPNPDDCDDSLAGVNPAATEVCDGIDNDCDAISDDLDDSLDLTTRSSFYADLDADGFGDPGALSLACAAPANTVVDDTDCDDGAAAVNPGATEVCNAGIDDDCDGQADDADPSLDLTSRATYFQDNDSDSFGSAVTAEACAAPAGFVSLGGDCDDARAAVNPAAVEVCNSRDDDCDGAADDADLSVSYGVSDRWFADTDGDTYGDPAVRRDRCVQPAGFVADATDCDDGAAAINPAAAEVCDSGIDNDCDGLADDADTFVVPGTRGFWYRDLDSDGFGAGAVSRSCAAPAGRVGNNTDCDDAAAAINPAAAEICDGLDNNCANGIDDADPSVDRSSTGTDYYIDADGDLYGDGALASLRRCAAPAGRVADDTDCDDTRSSVNPGLDELCNDGLDNDCDGTLGLTAGGDTCEPEEGAADLVAQRSFTGSDGGAAGATLTVGGDLNSDGVDDLVVSSPEYPTGGSSGLRFRGLVTVVAGSAGWALTDNSAATLASAAFVSFEGASGTDRLGYATGLGDFDGDGTLDLFLGAPGVGAATDTPLDRGAVYLLEGGFSAAGPLTVPDAVVREGTAATQYLGGSLAAGGTADPDARDDVLVGVPECASAVIGMGSAVSLLPGRVLLIGGAPSLSAFSSDAPRATFEGDENNACAGSAVLWADLDGDGIDEALIGEQNRDFGVVADVGRVYLADASLTGTVLLSSLPFLRGGEVSDRLGQYLAAGDLDGDGLEDLAVGESKDGTDRGAVHLISGDAFPALSATPESVASTTLLGAADVDFFGTALAVVGDMDGAPDGLPELLIGAQRASGTDVGAAYLLSGPLMGLGSRNISAAAGYTFTGATANGYLGTAAAAGDLNGDGVPDLAIGAARGAADPNGTVRVVLGLGY